MNIYETSVNSEISSVILQAKAERRQALAKMGQIIFGTFASMFKAAGAKVTRTLQSTFTLPALSAKS